MIRSRHLGLITSTAAVALAAVLLLAAAGTGPAEAAFPGSNGRIAFASGQEIAGGAEGDTDIFTMNPDGTGLVQLTGDTSVAYEGDPAYTPDGNTIAFVRQTGIWTMNADGSGQRFVVGITEPALARPAFSPDGTRIAYTCSAEPGNRDICAVNLDGTGSTRITTHPKDDIEPAWSPNGTRIAFASTRDEAPGTQNYDIFTIDADGTDPFNITNRPGNDLQPNWSPDGTAIAFASHYSPSGFYRNREIWSMNADGTEPTRLTNDASTDANPAYSPNGAKIAYESPKDGNPEIYVMNADGSEQTRITYNERTDGRPLGATYDGKADWRPLNADLSLTKTGSPGTVSTDQDLTYTLTTTNNGPSTANNTVLTDPLPSGTNFVSASSGCTGAENTVTCELGDLASGISVTTTIVVRATTGDTPSIENTASVSSNIRDANPANNTATEQTEFAINRPPDAVDDGATTSEDTSVRLNVLGNDTDPDGDSLTLTNNTQPAHGSASCSPSGECTYTPEADHNGAESFTYGITDGRGADTATVNITVIAVNDAPIADDLEITTDEDAPISIALAATDADDDPLTYSIADSPAHGTLSGTGANLIYTPDPNYNGPDSFAFTADDGAAESNVATVAITVSPVNDAPVISITEPAPGASTSDRTPTIRATVSDVETDLTASSISLRLDGQSRSYSYDRSTDRLVFTPSRKLSYGDHTVRIDAQDGAGLTATETWSFKVVRR